MLRPAVKFHCDESGYLRIDVTTPEPSTVTAQEVKATFLNIFNLGKAEERKCQDEKKRKLVPEIRHESL